MIDCGITKTKILKIEMEGDGIKKTKREHNWMVCG